MLGFLKEMALVSGLYQQVLTGRGKERDEGNSETPEMQIENLKPIVHLPPSPGPEARPLPVSLLSPPRENAAVLC